MSITFFKLRCSIRQKFNYYGEIKWKKISKNRLTIYKKFLTTFFVDQYATFTVLYIRKGHSWNAWGKSEEERFFKAYYLFLKLNAGPFSRYHVYPDDLSLQKKYRWETLHYLINKTRKNEWGIKNRNINILKPINSKQEDLLQLTDLLLGCLTSTATADAKDEIRKIVYDHIKDLTKNNKPKIKTKEWSPSY